jgi:hypothetical protein
MSNIARATGAHVINILYLAEFVLLQISAVYLICRLEFNTVSTGILLFLAAFAMEFLEFVQPREIMRWIPFWGTTVGRALPLIFLSCVAAMGNAFIGLLTFGLSVGSLWWMILGGSSLAPVPLLGAEELVVTSAEEHRRLSEERKEISK